jgi:hypothetical protein
MGLLLEPGGVSHWRGGLGPALASPALATGPRLPLTALLARLACFKALAIEAGLANQELAPLVADLQLDAVRVCLLALQRPWGMS